MLATFLLLIPSGHPEELALRLYGQRGRLLVDERLELEPGEARDFVFRYHGSLWTASLLHEQMEGSRPNFVVDVRRWSNGTFESLPPLRVPVADETQAVGFNGEFDIGDCLVVEPGDRSEVRSCNRLLAQARRVARHADSERPAEP